MPEHTPSRRRLLKGATLAGLGGAGLAFPRPAAPVMEPPSSNTIVVQGVHADGVTDDSQAFARSLRSAAGRELLVPAGSYAIGRQLQLAASGSSLRLAPGARLIWRGGDESCLMVTGEDVTIAGGTIVNMAKARATSEPWRDAVVEAKESSTGILIRDLTLRGVPHVGIGIRCGDARVENCTIHGDTPEAIFTGTETTHFGIVYDPSQSPRGGGFHAVNNTIEACVQGIMLGNHGAGAGVSQVISGNVLRSCWNHGVYQSHGIDNSTITGNTFFECQSPIAVTGRNNVVSSNACYTISARRPIDWAGIGLRDAVNCVVSNNTITGDLAPSAVAIGIEATEDSVEIRGNLVSGNVIDVGTTEGNSTVRLGGPRTKNLLANRVVGNNVRGGGSTSLGMVSIVAADGGRAFANEVTANTLTMTTLHPAVTVDGGTGTVVAGNTLIEDCSPGQPGNRVGIHSRSSAAGTLVQNTVIHCPPDRGKALALVACRLEGQGDRSMGTILPAAGYRAMTAAMDSRGALPVEPRMGTFAPGAVKGAPTAVGRIDLQGPDGAVIGYLPVLAD